MQKPVIPLTLAYITGLLIGRGFLYFPYSTSTLVVLTVLTTAVLTRIHKLSLHRFLFSVVPGLVGMAAYLYSAAWLPADHYTRLIPLDKTIHDVQGKIVSPLDRDPDRTGFVLELKSIDGAKARGKVRVSVREALTSPGYGDLVRFSCRLRRPGSFMNPGGFDYAEYLARSGIHATASLKSGADIAVIERGTGVFRTVQDRRERIRRAFLADTSGPGSAILQAMVLGEEGALTEGLRDLFLVAGVTHIISISGSHLGMVALLCFGLMRGLLFLLPERAYHRLTLHADPKKIAAWLTLPLIVFYTLLAGGQIATVRSLFMISAGLAALLLDREHALMHSLALAALAILSVSPQAVFDISFQLSYLSVLVIGYVVSVWNELGIKAEGWRRKILYSVMLLMIISLATGLATAPLTARYFNHFSFAGLVSNLIVVPFAGAVVVPVGLFSGIASLFTDHLPLAWLAQLVADIFIGSVAIFSRIPFAEFHPMSPAVLWLCFYAVFFLALLHHIRVRLVSRFKPFEGSSRVPLLTNVTLVVTGGFLLFGLTLSFLPGRHAAISFPDVGQGDCSLIELASGKTILIDAGGTHDNRFDIGRRVVAPYLWNRGLRRLDLVILSHAEADHMNGLLYIMRKFPVKEVWVHGLDTGQPGYDRLMRVIEENHVPCRIVSAEDAPYALGGAKLRVLHPGRGFRPKARKAHQAVNSRSLVVRMEDGGRSYLFTGDIGADAEKHLIGNRPDLKCDVLKVPHHGSKSSSSEPFVKLAGPGIAVVSAGRGNPYRHPADEVVGRYERIGARILRTDRDGAVLIRPNGDRLEAVRWSELMLQKVEANDRSGWRERELMNWERLRLRIWGT